MKSMANKNKEKIDKHKIRKEIRVNEKELSLLLTTHTPGQMTRVSYLFHRNQELKTTLTPAALPHQSTVPLESSTTQLEEIEKQYNNSCGVTEIKTYCKNCAAPNSHNVMNGKPRRFKCNKPLIVTFKKPMRKANPYLKGVSVTVEEQTAFFAKAKQLHV